MSYKEKEPVIKEKLAPGKLIKIILGVLFIATALFLIFYSLIMNQKTDKSESNSANAISSDILNINNVEQDSTVKEIQKQLTAQSLMSKKPTQTYESFNTLSNSQLQDKLQQEQDNKLVKVGTVRNYTAEQVPNNTEPQNFDPNSELERQKAQDLQQAKKSQLRVNINFGDQNKKDESQDSYKYAANNDYQSTSANIPSKFNASEPSSKYKPATDKDGFYVNTGGNDDRGDLYATPLASKYTVKAATYIPAILQGAINSDTPAGIVARVRQNVYDTATRKYLLIPKGATLLGSYSTNVQYGQERIIVGWNKLIYPDGSEVVLKGQPGTDMAGMGGILDEVNNHYWSLFGDAFVLSVITAGMQYNQQQYSQNYNGGQSFGGALSQSTGQMMGNTATQVISKGLNVAPTLTARNGLNFNILLTQDLVLQRPYVVKVYPGE